MVRTPTPGSELTPDRCQTLHNSPIALMQHENTAPRAVWCNILAAAWSGLDLREHSTWSISIFSHDFHPLAAGRTRGFPPAAAQKKATTVPEPCIFMTFRTVRLLYLSTATASAADTTRAGQAPDAPHMQQGQSPPRRTARKIPIYLHIFGWFWAPLLLPPLKRTRETWPSSRNRLFFMVFHENA